MKQRIALGIVGMEDSKRELLDKKLTEVITLLLEKSIENTKIYESYRTQFGLRVKKDPVIIKEQELLSKESEFLDEIRLKLFRIKLHL